MAFYFSFGLAILCVLSLDISHATAGSAGATMGPGWSSTCTECASIEDLRATSFGLEIAPDYITYAMKFPNGTLAPLIQMEPGRAYREVMVEWMREERTGFCGNPKMGIRDVFKMQNRSDIIKDELEHLIYDVEKYYPGLQFEYGGILVPDYIYNHNLSRSLVGKALNNTILPKSKYRDEILMLPTDFAVAAEKRTHVSGIEHLETWNYDALIITNTSSLLSASWFQFTWIPHAIGTDTHAKVDFPYLTNVNESDMWVLTPEHSVPKHLTPKPDLSRIKSFIDSKEALYAARIGPGQRMMSGNSRLVLRLNSTSETDIHEFGKEMNKILKGTRFDPSKATTTVFRDEDESWMWSPALHIANDTKARVDSALPDLCLDEHDVCLELKDCIRREALGELVLCEQPTIPQPTVYDRIEERVHEGLWASYRDSVHPWVLQLTNEFEARLWLLACKPDMPWSFSSLTDRCNEVIVPLPKSTPTPPGKTPATPFSPAPESPQNDYEDEQDGSTTSPNSSEPEAKGVLSQHLNFITIYLYTLPYFWLNGGTALSFSPIYLHYIGTENLLKAVFWGVHRVLGEEMYNTTMQLMVDAWDGDLKEFFEEMFNMEKDEKEEKVGSIEDK